MILNYNQKQHQEDIPHFSTRIIAVVLCFRDDHTEFYVNVEITYYLSLRQSFKKRLLCYVFRRISSCVRQSNRWRNTPSLFTLLFPTNDKCVSYSEVTPAWFPSLPWIAKRNSASKSRFLAPLEMQPQQQQQSPMQHYSRQHHEKIHNQRSKLGAAFKKSAVHLVTLLAIFCSKCMVRV